MKLQSFAVGQDKRLDRLVRFRDHDYWYLPPERRIQRLLVELRSANKVLNINQRAHVVLVIDLMFLFTLALLGACRHVSASSLADPREALLDYVLGGSELARARKQGLSDLAVGLKGLESQVEFPSEVLESLTVEPPYFAALAETTTRLLRRPRDAQRLLRYIEWWGQAEIGLGATSVVDALGAPYGDITRKLVGDIVRMCFDAAALEREWLVLAGISPTETAPSSGRTGPLVEPTPDRGGQLALGNTGTTRKRKPRS
jgi:hypothetical protein